MAYVSTNDPTNMATKLRKASGDSDVKHHQQMQNHQIIRDPKLLQDFIDWLPELGNNERYFLCLQARKKYMPVLQSSDTTILKRFVSRKESLFAKIRQLECAIGCYTTKDGIVIDDDGVALYITANPRDIRKATFNAAISLIGLIQKQDEHGAEQFKLKPHSEVLSQIHKSKARSAFVHFDVDLPTGDVKQDSNANKSDLTVDQIYKKSIAVVGRQAVTVVQTRGGFHVLVRPEQVVCETKSWYPILVRELNCDQTGDLMMPVVGCCQGGFVPTFHKPGDTVTDTNGSAEF